MHWYRFAKTTLALRKHNMRVDMHVHCGESTEFNNPNDMLSAIKGMLMAAIAKGLDVVGITAHNGPQMGLKAQEVASQNNYDIYVVPGQEYITSDNVRIIAYYLAAPLPLNLPVEQAIAETHKQNGLVMALGLTKRQARHMNKLAGTPSAPDMVEIYNTALGGFQDIECEFPEFISSASKSVKEMETVNIFTVVSREVLESMHIIPEGAGVDYEPQYLQNDAISQAAAARNPAQSISSPESPAAM